ncbi:LLM class flavin-dependent oxidoreductase [Leptothrix sp. BB-4]|uniref:Alkanesulfonate monooxygenase SsuD/methylene tetrahydromethanopterin reductase-like flavin-dependent oxidoreductase (Luciferase family) n=1 Tax=Sphaerotilus mobilis TaxID=47994 RepID=A0A4Q7LBA0_9BURK|nr:LLM class flavin-dependent oxidoreductase [Sphaerotilus mobilis]RZS46671.1 alkanesulfonate monooxygenase SsuD/methylene tetrahydromethanopterin reductase-like flavin-dependent oxidoreductase (luciferase family) [Sphaerotilus mobilis]
MKLGLFGMPLHPPTRPTAETYEENTDRVIHADELGFDEVWFGEHMSCTTEPIAAPLMFMASLLSRTKHVKFGTGVIALPNHHPAVVAAEVAQFDHMSRGRLMFGIGPGGLASDMELFQVLDNAYRSERMMESIDTILKLWRQDPPYHIEGKHWNIQLSQTVMPELGVGYIPKPFQLPHPPIMMTAMSPFSDSVKTAGQRGWSPMSANFCPEYVIASHWKKYLEGCELGGRKPNGDDWRVARNIVLARSDSEARDRVMDPAGSNYYYFEYLWKVLLAVNYTAVMKADPKQPDSEVTIEQLIDSMVVYGSPKTVTEKLLAFRERTGPFGALLMASMDGSGANRAREWESMTLLAREVMPKIRAALGR